MQMAQWEFIIWHVLDSQNKEKKDPSVTIVEWVKKNIFNHLK